MRLAISNLAWDVNEDEHVARLLQQRGIDAIDIAPGKYFPEPERAGDAELQAVRQWWGERGIAITGMQALLFGTQGLNVFGHEQSRHAMLTHLAAVCRIGGALGATRLVFGSPRNRDRSGLDDEQALEQAVSFFCALGDRAQAEGVIICLEPNPVRYGANFMTSSAETAAVVAAIDHPAIRMQFDSGALAINDEDPQQLLAAWAPLIGHVHASEPDLLPLGDGQTDHGRMHQALQHYLPDHIVCVEMLATREEAHLQSIERALQCAMLHYRPEQDGRS